jgi:hypothetical protein
MTVRGVDQALISNAAAALRALKHFPLRLTQRQVVIAGLDPQSIFFAKKFLRRKMDHPKSGLPDFGHFKCARRINPTCVVKPAGDTSGALNQSGWKMR